MANFNPAYMTASQNTGSLTCGQAAVAVTPATAAGLLTTAGTYAQLCQTPSTYSAYLPSSVGPLGSPGYTASTLSLSTVFSTYQNNVGQQPAMGLTAVAFPSKSLGVVVGLAAPLAPQAVAATVITTQMVGTFAFGQPGQTASHLNTLATPGVVQVGTLPNILTTIDGGNSWTVRSGPAYDV